MLFTKNNDVAIIPTEISGEASSEYRISGFCAGAALICGISDMETWPSLFARCSTNQMSPFLSFSKNCVNVVWLGIISSANSFFCGS